MGYTILVSIGLPMWDEIHGGCNPIDINNAWALGSGYAGASKMDGAERDRSPFAFCKVRLRKCASGIEMKYIRYRA